MPIEDGQGARDAPGQNAPGRNDARRPPAGGKASGARRGPAAPSGAPAGTGRSPTGPDRRQPTPPLSRDRVLDAAQALVESDGIGQLTVRGLAAKLNVAVTAIYWHVGDKQALLDGLAEHIIGQLGDVTARGRGPQRRITSIGRSLRQILLLRPDLVAVVHRQGRSAALFQPARRALVTELTAAGLRGKAAALAVHAIVQFVIGSVLVDRQIERQPMQREASEDLWTADDVPDAPELLAHLVRPVDEQQLFDFSLSVLVHALIDPADRPR